jgi:hypothetical protein
VKRLIVPAVTMAVLLVIALPAHAAPAPLTVSGTCQVDNRNQDFQNGQLTNYQFVQQSDTTFGVVGDLVGTCPLVDETGQPTGELVPFGPAQVTFTNAQVQLDCFTHTFIIAAGSGASTGTDAGNGVTVFNLSGGQTLTGTTKQQQKDICATKAKLDKNPPTDVKSTATDVQLLNNLSADF